MNTLSVTESPQTVTVGYQVTEATLTAEAAHPWATMTISASHDGAGVDLDGRGATQLAVPSGEETVAVPLGVGTTELSLTVTAEDGTSNSSHLIKVSRQALGAATEVAVASAGFSLTCPAEVARGAVATCDLTNTNSSSNPWPVVAVIHNSADSHRALVAEDPIIPDTDPAYSKDVTLSAQQPAPDGFNYGYGELFSGGSRSVYRTYGYQKFDWSGSAAAGASREVSIELHDNSADAGREVEVFYVAVAPSDYTGLTQLVANTAPIVLRRTARCVVAVCGRRHPDRGVGVGERGQPQRLCRAPALPGVAVWGMDDAVQGCVLLSGGVLARRPHRGHRLRRAGVLPQRIRISSVGIVHHPASGRRCCRCRWAASPRPRRRCR